MKKVGIVSDYFKNIGVIAVNLSAKLKQGDKILVKSSEKRRVEQEVISMQEDRKDIKEAGKGSDVGVKLDKNKLESQPHKGDEVYKT